MPGGAYSALSGMRMRLDDLDRLAADLANAGTAGYKTERTSTEESRRAFASALDSAIDVTQGGRRTNFVPGTITSTGRELDMALKLVDEMSMKWDPAAFSDTYRQDLMKRIEEKLEAGQTHALTQPEAGSSDTRGARGGKVVDLMSLLERSLEQHDRAGSAGDGSARGSKRKHSAARRRSLHLRAARRA